MLIKQLLSCVLLVSHLSSEVSPKLIRDEMGLSHVPVLYHSWSEQEICGSHLWHEFALIIIA